MSAPVQPACFARLNAAEEEINRRKQEVLNGIMAALSAQKEGKDHPRLLTRERKEALYMEELKRREHMEMSARPELPRIIVTRQESEFWGDFTDTRRGRFGTILQE